MKRGPGEEYDKANCRFVVIRFCREPSANRARDELSRIQKIRSILPDRESLMQMPCSAEGALELLLLRQGLRREPLDRRRAERLQRVTQE